VSQSSGSSGDGIVGPDIVGPDIVGPDREAAPTADKWHAAPTDVTQDQKYGDVPTDGLQYKPHDVSTDAPALGRGAGFTGGTGGISRTGLVVGVLLTLLLLTGGGVFLMAKQGVFGCQSGTTPRAMAVEHTLSQCQSSHHPNPGVSGGTAVTVLQNLPCYAEASNVFGSCFTGESCT
jgi:hypothetical protein